MKIKIVLFVLVLSIMTSFKVFAQTTQPGEVLPDRRPGTFKGKIGETTKDSKPDFPITREAAKDAPNVVLILLDDVGFGASSTFGGPIDTPTADRLAKEGLRYTQWHTTSLCSPTRASLLTGRNHHEEGFGVVAEMATGYPGYNGIMSDETATIGTILRDNGYNTAWFGKNHNTPDYETSQVGPFTQWPVNMGFEYFYGFNGGDCNQYAPPLIENTQPISPPIDDPDYNLTKDLTEKCIGWIRRQKSIAPNKPFFAYFAPGATHAPHQPPKEWIEKFKGKFDQGWNKVSEETFERMKTKGIIPANAKYNPIPEEVGVWDKMNADQKKVYARMMEVYAAYLAYVDYEVGLLVDAIDELGARDNTLIIYAIGDNGASAEGGFSGTLNEVAADLNSYRPDVVKDALSRLDQIGGPDTYNHYPIGWALAMNSPMKYAKRESSHFGGTRNGLIISWPKGIKDQGGIRTQFSHCNDIAPTILESCKLPQPKVVNGVKQKPMSGVSMYYTFNKANEKAPTKHVTQYFEMGGNRAIYDNGWVAATTHNTRPWLDEFKIVPPDQDVWELYNITNDFTEHDDLAKENPKKLEELKLKWKEEAKKYQVLPFDDSTVQRMDAKTAGRPAGSIGGLTHLTYYPGTTRVPEGSAPNVKNRSYTITAEIDIPQGGAEGVLVTQGGLFAGYVLMIKDGKPVFIYNWLQEQITTIEGKDKLSTGKHTIKFDFTYDGGGRGKGGNGVLSVDGKSVAQKHIEKTIPNRFSFDETFDVGEDAGTPVTRDYKIPFKFTGKLKHIVIDLK
ncbi:arylsulfatase [Flavobacterium ustbae]|uniref:arylsulfatase n=1 Tax=Flavobacterium ustbae TaxID=2488790 RepID=UPI000F7670DA|nr:arylsulfatase [Flavobacterium ustbae]